MAWDDAVYVAAFDAEAGVVASLATAAQKVLWFNESQARLLKYKPTTADITWLAADRSVALPTDFVELQKLVTTIGNEPQPWRVLGKTLVLDSSDGAGAAGGGRLYYWAEWPLLVIGGADSQVSNAQDYACLHYALSRFFRRLSSNRMYYKRYATLVGQNAVSVSDLQQESDRYYQDFLEARDDSQPIPPAFFFEG